MENEIKTMPEWERGYQVGNIVRIRKEPRRATLHGFTFGTEHVIQEPPKESKVINCNGGVWLRDRVGRLRYLTWPHYTWTGKCKMGSEGNGKQKRTRKKYYK